MKLVASTPAVLLLLLVGHQQQQHAVQADATLNEIAQHNTASDCWTAVGATVYDLSAFIQGDGHPNTKILRLCGVDGKPCIQC